MRRRLLLKLTVFFLALNIFPMATQAVENYPNKPIRFIVPFAPGGVTDFMARLISNELGNELGQPVVVENHGGSGGAIGSNMVANATPDGYTILLGTSATHAMNPHITQVSFDPINDFESVGLYGSNSAVLVVHPDFPPKNVEELIQYIKDNPGELSYASQGIGTSGHLSGEVLKQSLELDLTHIPYRGSGPALIDVLSGEVPMMFDNITPSLPHIQDGKLRPLAVTSKERSPLLPNVPTLDEDGFPGFDVTGWIAIFVPADTPKPIIEKLNTALHKAVNSPGIEERLQERGIVTGLGTPEELADYLKSEHERWGKVIREAGITPES